MAYWWVSQNKTFREERSGGYLWAPKRGKDGREFHHWSNMTLVQPGDIVLSYAQQCIGAIGVASSACYDAPQPREFGDTWEDEGRRVDVQFQEVTPPLPLVDFVNELQPLLPEANSPITRTQKGVLGYLFALPPSAGRLVCGLLGQTTNVDDAVTRALQQTVPDRTTKEALVQARVGQGRWRRDLLGYWSSKCAISGLSVERLLRASHVKPWRDADNRERLDVFNGILLSPAYDAAFDAGLITFDESGAVIISAALRRDDLECVGIRPDARLRKVEPRHAEYLDYHRTYIFGS